MKRSGELEGAGIGGTKSPHIMCVERQGEDVEEARERPTFEKRGGERLAREKELERSREHEEETIDEPADPDSFRRACPFALGLNALQTKRAGELRSAGSKAR